MHRPVWHWPLDVQPLPSMSSGAQIPLVQLPELSHGAVALQTAPSGPLATHLPPTHALA